MYYILIGVYMRIKRSSLKRIIENFLKEQDQPSMEDIDQSIKDAEEDIVKSQGSDRKKEFIKKHGKKMSNADIQSIGALARPLVLKLNKEDLKDDSVLIARALAFLKKGENQTALDILKNKISVKVSADKKTGKIIKRKLTTMATEILETKDEFKQIIELIEKYQSQNSVKDDYNFLDDKKEEEPSPQPPQAKEKNQKKQNIQDIQDMLNELGVTDYGNNKLTVDGAWGAKSRSALSKFLVAIKDSYQGTDESPTSLTKTSIDFNKLSIGKELKKDSKGVWQKAVIEMSGEADQYAAANRVLAEIMSAEIEVNTQEEEENKIKEKYPGINEKAPNKFINLLNVKKGAYKTPSNTPSVTISAKQRFNITDPKFKNVLIDGPDFSGKKKGSYMLSLTMDRRFGTGGSTFDIYYLGGKTGSLRLDGPQFYNYQINGYAKLADGSLVPADYAESLEE